MVPRTMTNAKIRASIAALIAIILMAVSLPAAVAQSENPGQGKALGRVRDVVLVGYERGASKAQRGKAAKSVDATSVRKLSKSQPDVVAMKLPPGQSVDKAIEKLERQSGVRYAEPDYLVQPAAISDDPYVLDGRLWGMLSGGSGTIGTGAAEAWAAGATGSETVYVGVIDTGIQYAHPDLAGNVDESLGWDFYNNDATVYDGTFDDHGTHVAGTIGAKGGNGIGVAGVNWDIRIIPVKFIGSAGTGSFWGATQAVQHITDLKLDHGLNIVATNNSWGCLHHPVNCPPNQTLLDAIERAGDAGILFIAAAGNDGVNLQSTPYWPASQTCTETESGETRPDGFDCIVSVASITKSGELSFFSNYGSESADLGAPGGDLLFDEIWSTIPGGYGEKSGTSMATPHVTGAVALCASLDPSLSAAAIRSLLMSSTAATGSLDGKTVSNGGLDIGAMARLCGSTVPDLSGPASAADAKITGAGLTVGTVSREYSDTVTLDHVIRQDPVKDMLVSPLTKVDYVVSDGPAPPPQVTVPDVVGQPEASARTTIGGVGLVAAAATTSAYHPTIPAGAVISTSPAVGTSVDPGSSVSLHLSDGPAPPPQVTVPDVVVPDVVGKLESVAKDDLLAAGLTVGTRTTAHHATIAAGRVISTTPAAGDMVSPSTRVDYVVSLGPVPVAVPDPGSSPITVTVDDLSKGFTRRWSGWREAASGYKRHHYWVPTRVGTIRRVGKWKATVIPGTYEIQARIPNVGKATRRAQYQIKTADRWVKRVRNQHQRRGRWLSLGVFELGSSPAVKLRDRSGEPRSLRRRVVFDAIRFVPVSSSPATQPATAKPRAPEPTPVTTSSAKPKAAPDATPPPTPEPTSAPAPKPTPAPTSKPKPEPAAESEPEPTPPPTPAAAPEEAASD